MDLLPASPDVYQASEGFHRWMLEALAAGDEPRPEWPGVCAQLRERLARHGAWA